MKRDDAARFWAKVQKGGPGDCWPWIGYVAPNGYGRIALRRGNGRDKKGYRTGTTALAHRFSWEVAHGAPPPQDKLLCHSCDNRRCVNPEHLFLGTHADNAVDMVRKGRAARGVRVAQAKLTDDEVAAMRSRAAAGESVASIARDARVCHSVAWRAIHGETWTHVRNEAP